ncbi:unnamed protein product [Linum tenue]|uniref:KIB1-4 beta-propeller domain-containing protein n=1 Tax=Linum tenue TaxID=586396 RepID=A0AAV0IZ94_9ROSI|nr:unnamed protein product [Linum tenue]
MTEPTEQPDWLQLPGDLVETIIHRRLTKLQDFIHSRSVCKQWRSLPLPEFRQSLPWLVSPCKSKSANKPKAVGCNGNLHRITDVTATATEIKNKKPRLQHVNLADGPRRVEVQCLGSAFGWLLLKEERSSPPSWGPILCLMNPLTRNKIYLPRETTAGQGTCVPCCIARFLMSAAPTATKTEESITVVLLYQDGGGGLAFCKLGWDERWTLVPFHDHLPRNKVAEIVSWRGKIHVLCEDDGRVLAYDHLQPKFSLAFLAENSANLFNGERPCNYRLVVSPEGELMLLISHCESVGGRVKRFSIYRAKEDGRRWRWDAVGSIGDYALFFDSSRAVYVSVRDHPECRRDCVYYMGNVYDLKMNEFVHRSGDGGPAVGNWILPSSY